MRYGRVVRGRLVLWDVDHTLLDAGGAGVALLRQAFTELFGCPFPATPPMAGRTDRAIELEILTRAGLADPAAQLPAFQRLVAGLAPEFGELVRSGGRVLPGAAEALAAVAALAGREHRAGPVGADRQPAGDRPGRSWPRWAWIASWICRSARTATTTRSGPTWSRWPGPARPPPTGRTSAGTRPC